MQKLFQSARLVAFIRMIKCGRDLTKWFSAQCLSVLLVVLTGFGFTGLAGSGAYAAPLVVVNVGSPTVVGSGQGKRALWEDAGTVGATTVDIVAEITTASRDHNLTTTNGRPSITSTGQDTVWITWSIYQANTHNISTNTGGVPVVADSHVQFNDADGPSNEEIYVPVCDGSVEWIRIATAATTGRVFGTVGGVPEVFSLIGDQNYNQEPNSGLEISYPNASSFTMGRTANNNYYIRLDNPSYLSADTVDYVCADFATPLAVDDAKEGVPGVATVLSILNNDSAATENDNPPNNNTLLPGEYAKTSVKLIPPGGETGVLTDSQGDIVGFTMPGEGTWAYDDLTGVLTFTPVAFFKGVVTPITYTFENGLNVVSNAANVAIIYPAIGVTVTSVVNDLDVSGDNNTGDTIDYTYNVVRFGMDLNTITLAETGFVGGGVTPTPVYVSGDDGDSILEDGETWVYTSTYTIVAGDVTNGVVTSLATGTGLSAGLGTLVTDIADSGNPADGDGTATPGPGTDNDDPHHTPMASVAIVATDDIISSPIDTVAAVNIPATSVLGNDLFNGVAIPLPVNQTVIEVTPNGAVAGFTVNPDGSIDVAKDTASGSYTIGYQICEKPGLTNCDTATVSLTIEKSVPSVTGFVYYNDNGNAIYDGSDTPRAGYTVQLVQQNGTVVKSAISASDGSYRIQDFAPDTYDIIFREPASGAVIGSIQDVVFAIDAVLANQNQPIDPSGVIYSSQTGSPLAGANVTITSAAGVALPTACLLPGQQPQVTPVDGSYAFDLILGADVACPVGETEYRLAIVSPPGYDAVPSSVTAPQAGTLDATTCPGDAIADPAVCEMSASNMAPAPASPTPYYLAFLLAAGDPNVVNNHIPLDPNAAIPDTGLTIENVVSAPIVRRGDYITYTITVRNHNPGVAGPVTVVDVLPAGFTFVPGSATADGVSTTPSVNGRQVTFTGLTIPGNDALVLTIGARISALVDPGDYADPASLHDPANGMLLAPIATAYVRVIAEHVFDCGEIIGKVFDDRNRDGSQSEGEPGLPGVRLATVKGVLITTDRQGRYSVPCADIPAAGSGSNFILKLDVRTLPAGYDVTSENPRVVRLTRGKIAKLNFGASAGRIVKVDLSRTAFSGNSVIPSQHLVDGIEKLVVQMSAEPGVLKITYHDEGEGERIAQARLDVVKQLIVTRWQARFGDGELNIEFRIAQKR